MSQKENHLDLCPRLMGISKKLRWRRAIPDIFHRIENAPFNSERKADEKKLELLHVSNHYSLQLCMKSLLFRECKFHTS